MICAFTVYNKIFCIENELYVTSKFFTDFLSILPFINVFKTSLTL